MAKNTQPQCCARFQSRLRMDERDLAHAARRAARAPEAKRWHDEIARLKGMIATDKQNIIDHEASHAGEAQ